MKLTLSSGDPLQHTAMPCRNSSKSITPVAFVSNSANRRSGGHTHTHRTPWAHRDQTTTRSRNAVAGSQTRGGRQQDQHTHKHAMHSKAKLLRAHTHSPRTGHRHTQIPNCARDRQSPLGHPAPARARTNRTATRRRGGGRQEGGRRSHRHSTAGDAKATGWNAATPPSTSPFPCRQRGKRDDARPGRNDRGRGEGQRAHHQTSTHGPYNRTGNEECEGAASTSLSPRAAPRSVITRIATIPRTPGGRHSRGCCACAWLPAHVRGKGKWEGTHPPASRAAGRA